VERGRTGARGFTLVEILVVVAMIGVLATIAIVSIRRYMQHARIADEKKVLEAITVGLKNYNNETGGYPNCSASFVAWYPMDPNGKKHRFTNPAHGDHACWSLLHIDTDAPIYSSYSLRAGAGGTPMPTPLFVKVGLTLGTPPDAWYMLHAATDLDEDKVYGYTLLLSTQPGEVLTENEGE
jgi:type IV pilus assembly protein PilA